VVVCALGNPFKKFAVFNIQLRFDPKELNDTENQLTFEIFSNSTSHEVNSSSSIILRANVIKQAELSLHGYVLEKLNSSFNIIIKCIFSLARPEHVFYGGPIKDNSLVKYRDEVGSRVLHTYQVVNSGPWKVSGLQVHIEWPYQVSISEKWLLYLDEKPYVEGECIKTTIKNPFHTSLK